MANAMGTVALVEQLDRRMAGDAFVKTLTPLAAQTFSSLLPAMNEIAKVGALASDFVAKNRATLVPAIEAIRRVQEMQTRTARLTSISHTGLHSSFAAQGMASVVAKSAFADVMAGSSMAQLAQAITAASTLKQAQIAHTAGLRSTVLQSSFASQHALVGKSMAEALRPYPSAVVAKNLSRAFMASELYQGVRMENAFRTLELSAAVTPRPIDDIATYHESARTEQVVAFLEDSDVELEAFEIQLDAETRLYLANSVPVDVGMFMAATAFANSYLPDRPLANPVAGGIGLAAMYLVRWGADFVHRGGAFRRSKRPRD